VLNKQNKSLSQHTGFNKQRLLNKKQQRRNSLTQNLTLGKIMPKHHHQNLFMLLLSYWVAI